MNLKKQLFRLNCLGFFTCLRISDAVWVALLAARGYRLWEIGAAEGIFHVVSLLFEIPSGMAADLLGRRRSLAAAGLCGVLSGLLMALEQGFGWICLAMVFSALACNFVSGSDEALLYDSLLQTGKQEQYLQVNLRYTQMQNAGGLVSNMASMLTQAVNYTGFYLIDAAVGVLRMVAALGLEEPAVTQRQRNRGVQSLSTLARELKRHIRETAVALGENRRMREYMLADGILSLPGFLTLMFLQQRLTEFGLSAAWLGLPVICIALSRKRA